MTLSSETLDGRSADYNHEPFARPERPQPEERKVQAFCHPLGSGCFLPGHASWEALEAADWVVRLPSS